MRSTVILTLVVLACACGNGDSGGVAEGPRMPLATSADGELTLRIAHLQLDPSEFGSGTYVLSLDAELVDPPDSVFLSDHPPVAKALTSDDEDLAAQGYIDMVQPRDRRVSVSQWAIGRARDRIETLDLRLMVVRVAKWSERVYEDLGPDESEPLPLGMFEARVAGDDSRLTVTLRTESAFDEEHTAYGMVLPQSLHTPTFHLGLLTVTDAEGRALEHAGEGGDFAIFERRGKDGPGKIAYPVTLRSRIPEELEVNEEAFVFTGLKLPPPVKPE